ncbi:MAG: molybdopterin dinucleotide binding domain-containing protein [Candidatus Lernaella stagnicola]|nr:molybdopterin dinucleotide binding domain-containing protein [Candidatus Lernaella stagnicola]
MRIARRHFISWGLAGAAVLGVEGLGRAFYGHVMRTSSRMDEPIPSVCRACPAGCGIVGYLRNKTKLTAIMGNPDHPVSRGKICALGVAAMNLQLHPERLWQARRRDGSVVDTAAAIAEAGEKIARLIGDGARLVIDTWDEQQAHADFVASLDGRATVIGREALEDSARARGMEAVWDSEVRPDLDRADLLLVFEDQPLDGGPRFLPDAQRIIEARVERGMKMVVFDPRLSATGSKADLWVPIRPGTARVAVLAVLRQALEHANLGATISMRGQYVPLVTLAESIGAYTTEYAAQVCGVEAELLREAGRLLIEADHPATMAGQPVFEGDDTEAAYAAIALIDLVFGLYQIPVMPRPRLVASENAASAVTAERIYREIEAGEGRDIVLISHRSNPVYERGAALEKALSDGRLAYHLAITPLPNETAAAADLVIPETVPLEGHGRVWLTSYVSTPTYVEQRPVAPPPKGVPATGDVFNGLGKAQVSAGVPAPAYDLQMVRDYTGARQFIAIGTGVYAADAGFDPRLAYRVPVRFFRELPPLESREPEVFRPVLLLRGSAVVNETGAQAKWLAEIQHAAPLYMHPDDARRLRVHPGDYVQVWPEHGDRNMAVDAKVFVSDGVRPGCVAMIEGEGHVSAGRLALAKPFTTAHDPDMKLIWWEREGAGVNLAPFQRREINADSDVVKRPPTRLWIRRL